MCNNRGEKATFWAKISGVGTSNRILNLLILATILSLISFSCITIIRPEFMAGTEPGWVAVTGIKAPAPAKLDRIISTGKQLKIKFQVFGFNQEIIREKEDLYQSIKIPDAGVSGDVGRPNLPVIRHLVALPQGKRIRVRLYDTVNVIRLNYNIYPVQPPLVEQGPYRTEFKIDEKFYNVDAYSPRELVTISKTMIMRGQQVVQLEIFPVQYNPAQKTVRVYTNIGVDIEFEDLKESEGFGRPPKEDSLRVQLADWKSFKQVLNFDYLRDQLYFFRGAQYLIITADNFYEEIIPLSEWKKMKGLTISIVKMSSVGTTDTDIRKYISDAYHNWLTRPSYVLLVGDVEHIPTHTYDSNTATDLFYACVDGTDYLPDLAVGRFPAKNETDVTGMVNKTINYEKTPVVTSDDWYTKMSLVSDEGYFERTSDSVYNYMTAKGYKINKYYRSAATATPANISTATNDGRIILNYRGHGSVTGWGTGAFYNANVLALQNKHMTPVIISPTCQTGWFDHATSDCFGETWLKSGGTAANIGGVGFWGSSRNSYGGFNDELCKGVYKASFNDGLSTLGDITNRAKMYMFDFYGDGGTTELEFNLFNVLGDPELNIWFQTPSMVPAGWKAIDLDILGGKHVGGVNKEVLQDVGGQNAFSALSYPYSPVTGKPACFVTFSVPSDWDGLSDFTVDFIWYSPTQDGNIKWSIVYDRKDVSQTPFTGFNRNLQYFWGARKEKVSHSSLEIWSLTRNGPINSGDLITVGLERFQYNSNESGVTDAITSAVNLIAARVIYKTK